MDAANEFEIALNGRIDGMLDACTWCGKCVDACPSIRPAGIADARPVPKKAPARRSTKRAAA